MNNALLKLYIKLQALIMQEDGQDLVEYALVAGLITVGAVASIKVIGTEVSTLFSNVSTTI